MVWPASNAAADAGGMSDFWKIVFAALLGLFTGIVGTLIADPLKKALALFLKKRRIEKAFSKELRGIGEQLRKADSLLEENPTAGNLEMEARIVAKLNTEAFDYYSAHDTEAVLQMKGWNSLRVVFGEIKEAKEQLRQHLAVQSSMGDNERSRRKSLDAIKTALWMIHDAVEPELKKRGQEIRKLQFNKFPTSPNPPITPPADSPESSLPDDKT